MKKKKKNLPIFSTNFSQTSLQLVSTTWKGRQACLSITIPWMYNLLTGGCLQTISSYFARKVYIWMSSWLFFILCQFRFEFIVDYSSYFASKVYIRISSWLLFVLCKSKVYIWISIDHHFFCKSKVYTWIHSWILLLTLQVKFTFDYLVDCC